MGVHSFWDVVGPTARPVRLESLQDRRMAVDASIWIYQFLKAVRDQEGNALKNSHIVGFFRRICKLLFFGIKPVFVFDGGVPLLKRQTIQQRKERRQGKRDSAAKTARKLLAIQLQKQQEQGSENESPSKKNPKPRDDYQIFKPEDEWDLPVIPGFKYDENDQRIVSEKAFREYKNSIADEEFDNIDLETINPASAEFEELPKSTQYLILSTLRLRSRLRMGYSKEQLENLFPDSMNFSKFQIDMVKRRNFFTQKLMGVTGTHDGGASKLDDEVVNRISGQLHKEYKLTKTENGWILGLGDLDGSENKKAILLDENGNSTPNSSKRYAENGSISVNQDNSHNDNDDDDDSSEWEDIDTRPQNTKRVEDYSIKAARLPQLNMGPHSTGSQSFLDKRYDHVSPVKQAPVKLLPRIVEDDVDNSAMNESQESDDDNDERIFERHMHEIEVMEAIQKSKHQSQQEASNERQTIMEREKTTPSHASDGSTKVNAEPTNLKTSSPKSFNVAAVQTENEQNLNQIVSKIPNFELAENTSFLFQDTNKTNTRGANKGEKPAYETPAWFQPAIVRKNNPYEISNFVGDKELPNTKASDSYELVTGGEAQELLKSNIDNSEDVVEISETESKPSTDLGEKINKIADSTDTRPRSSAASVTSDVSAASNASDASEDPSRKPLAFDYDFSEEEEDNMVENMRKEEAEFATFKNTLNNKIVDNAFMEDELFEQQIKEKRDSDEVTTEMILEVQDLLSRFGIPYVIAPMEAEAQCAELLRLNLVDGVVTDDSDVFLFGGTKIYKNMFHERNYVEFYDVDSIFKKLGLDRENMIDLAHLLGSDYTAGIKSMGPVSSMEVLAEFGNLVKFRDWYKEGQFNKKKQEGESKFEKELRRKLVKNEVVLDSEFPSELVRDSYLHPEVDYDETPFVWGTPDLDMLRVFMKKRVGWPQEKTDEILIPLIRDINNRKTQRRQMTLTEFFPTEYIEKDKSKNFGKRIATATGKLKNRRLE